MVILTRERVAFGLLLLLAVAFSLTRITSTDTPWHLATAHYAFETGHWPTTNTFSYTYPDFPLYQQYPIYQTLLYLVHFVGGWEGLSILHCVAWTSIFALWVRWGAPWRYACVLSLAFLVALLGLQRRMILRPDLMTMLLLVCLLHLIDFYRQGRTWAAAGFVLVQWLMANSHQLFPLGLAVQGAFLGHLVASRWLRGRFGVSERDVHLPIWPVAFALFASLIACLGTPIGLRMLLAPLQTAGSLEHHRQHVSEFRPVTADGWSLTLVLIAGTLAIYSFYRNQKDWSLFELGLLLMGTALVVAAQRGTAFFCLFAVGIFARSMTLQWKQEETSSSAAVPSLLSGRSLQALICIALTLFFLQIRWVSPSRILGGTQPGIGRSLGDFPDAAIAFLKANPPPGKMLNLGWYAGNMLVWELFPTHPVFVDPRFEAYPREFLLSSIHAMEDDKELDLLIEQNGPSWIVGEVRIDGVRKRAARLLQQGTWKLVHADTVWIILVRMTPRNGDYLAKHAIEPAEIVPVDLLESEPDLLALQYLRLAKLYEDFGVLQKAQEMKLRAEELEVD